MYSLQVPKDDDPLFFTEYHNLLLSLAVNGHQGGYAYNRRDGKKRKRVA
jgi:hypothetical protein